MRNCSIRLVKALLLILIVWTPCSLVAEGFDKNLNKIHAMRSSKKFKELVPFLEKNRASAELKDLRLFLMAEGLKNIGNKDGALRCYEELLKKFPESEAAFQGRLPHFLLALENATERDVPRLEGFARALPTSWQRGTALEKLASLKFLKPSKMSRLSLMAIREFHSDKPFYKSIPASHDLIKKILSNVEEYVFEDDEWLNIFVLASEEDLTAKFFKNWKKHQSILGRWGGATLDILRAMNLGKTKAGFKEAEKIFSRYATNSKIDSTIVAFANQARAEMYYKSGNYEAAIRDYKSALKKFVFPINVRACQYRLMRSAFYTGRDSECLELLSKLVKVKNPEPIFPAQIYEMALDRFDNNRAVSSVPFFMFLSRNFPAHYRADDAIGYSIIALGKKSKEGQTLFQLLKKKYPNSFFIYWVSPESHTLPIPFARKPSLGRLNSNSKKRLAAWKKLWKTDFVSFAREEARKMTDKYPRNLALYKGIMGVCTESGDYNHLTAYAERLARQLLEGGKSLAEMPLWAWKAHYPDAYMSEVRPNAKKNNIDPHWILSIMREESHFKPDTISRSNAMGLMQILPSTGKWIAGKIGHRRFSQKHLWKPGVNVEFGSWYLKYLSDLFNGDLFLAAASYNGGQGNVLRKVEKGPFSHLGVLERLDKIPLSETRDYYKKVMGSYWNYQRLYGKK